ncbi:MAG: hypothetical protein J7K83_04035 [Candidatus Aenigmarchaeota archaeon]|nr:hypothetical protein [Candidatus Aenigmarchaeota archaeon]
MNAIKIIYNLVNFNIKPIYEDSIRNSDFEDPSSEEAIKEIDKKFSEWEEYCQKNMNFIDSHEESGSWGESYISGYRWEGNLILPNDEVKNGEFLAILEKGANDTGDVWASLTIYEIY